MEDKKVVGYVYFRKVILGEYNGIYTYAILAKCVLESIVFIYTSKEPYYIKTEFDKKIFD